MAKCSQNRQTKVELDPPPPLIIQNAFQILKDNKSTHKFVIVDEAHIVKFWGEGDDKLKKAFRGAFKRLAESISVMMVSQMTFF